MTRYCSGDTVRQILEGVFLPFKIYADPVNIKFLVEPGLNDVTIQLHLHTVIYPDPDKLPPLGESQSFYLGDVTLTANLFDIQTRTIACTETFDTIMSCIIENSYY